MDFFRKKTFVFYFNHILHVFIQKVTFIFFNTAFFVYSYRRKSEILEYSTICLFLLPSFVFHLMEMFYIKYSKRHSIIEEIEYILFTCFYLLITGQFIDCYFTGDLIIFTCLITIHNALSAKIGVFYNYSFYERCFNEEIFRNRILLIIFEGLPVYFSAAYMSYVDSYKTFKPYFYVCSALYLATGSIEIINLRENGKIEIIEDPREKKVKSISLLSVFCRVNEIFLYLVLISKTENVTFVVFYFSIDFIFRLFPLKLPKNLIFKIMKIVITISTFYFIINQDMLHIYIAVIIFLANGFTNQMVYNTVNNTLMEKTVENFLVFLIFSVFMVFFARKYCLRDFIFFNDVKL